MVIKNGEVKGDGQDVRKGAGSNRHPFFLLSAPAVGWFGLTAITMRWDRLLLLQTSHSLLWACTPQP